MDPHPPPADTAPPLLVVSPQSCTPPLVWCYTGLRNHKEPLECVSPDPPHPPTHTSPHPPVCARSVAQSASCGLLIQHLSHSERRLCSWPFLEGASNLSTPTHADAQMLLPALTSLHTASSCPKFKPPPWEITQSLSSHRPMKYTPLESNCGGWRDCECVRWEKR